MAITINGSGSITGISAGGLPDGSVTNADLANSSVTVNGTSIALGGSENITAGKILKITKALDTTTRYQWGQNTGTVLSGIDFRYPNDSRVALTFTKDSASADTDIIFNLSICVGGTYQVHSACLWRSDFSTHMMLGFDGHRIGTICAECSDYVTGSYLFTGLAAGSHTFYFSLGRRGGNSAPMEWRMNADNADSDDKAPSSISQVLVYEVAK